jgi:hypothetical protein
VPSGQGGSTLCAYRRGADRVHTLPAQAATEAQPTAQVAPAEEAEPRECRVQGGVDGEAHRLRHRWGLNATSKGRGSEWNHHVPGTLEKRRAWSTIARSECPERSHWPAAAINPKCATPVHLYIVWRVIQGIRPESCSVKFTSCGAKADRPPTVCWRGPVARHGDRPSISQWCFAPLPLPAKSPLARPERPRKSEVCTRTEQDACSDLPTSPSLCPAHDHASEKSYPAAYFPVLSHRICRSRSFARLDAPNLNHSAVSHASPPSSTPSVSRTMHRY